MFNQNCSVRPSLTCVMMMLYLIFFPQWNKVQERHPEVKDCGDIDILVPLFSRGHGHVGQDKLKS